MDRMTLLMLGMIAFAPCACSASTGAEPVAISLSPRLAQWHQFVAEANQRFGIPQAWIYAVMDAESAGRTLLSGRPTISHAGAMGLMQVMPETYQEMRTEHGLGPDPHVPLDNILAGTAYLRAMYDRFGFPGLFAAYNAGPQRYEDYVKRNRPLPHETIAYLEKIGARGLSDADMAALPKEPHQERAPETSSGPDLFFLKKGDPGAKPNREILLPLAPE